MLDDRILRAAFLALFLQKTCFMNFQHSVVQKQAILLTNVYRPKKIFIWHLVYLF